MKKVVGLVVGLLPISAFAECVPVPDCASIGYTETSCEGDSLKCPFDASKLRCFPCDSLFRYSCSGENITGGVGNACNGKYSSCSCSSSDYVFINGKCVCDTRCNVGAIYYSDGTCNRCLIEGKTPVGVVVKDNEIIAANNVTELTWGGSGTDIAELANFTTQNEADNDYNGFYNTSNILNILGNTNISDFAAIYCYNYAPTELEGTKGEWYLPAAGEIYNYIYKNYSLLKNIFVNKLSWTTFAHCLWSSSEGSSTAAWVADTYSTYRGHRQKSGSNEVICFMAIN